MPEDKNNTYCTRLKMWLCELSVCRQFIPGSTQTGSGGRHTAAILALSRWRQGDPKFKAILTTLRLAGHPRLHGTLSPNDDAGDNYDKGSDNISYGAINVPIASIFILTGKRC